MKWKPLSYCILCIAGMVACNQPQQQPAVPVAKTWEDDSTNVIDISNVKTVLPQAGNVELVEMHCTPCHSLRYIEMQPQLSHKAWEKIVDKMINAYGAPIRDSVTRVDIINYLYAIKGTDD